MQAENTPTLRAKMVLELLLFSFSSVGTITPVRAVFEVRRIPTLLAAEETQLPARDMLDVAANELDNLPRVKPEAAGSCREEEDVDVMKRV